MRVIGLTPRQKDVLRRMAAGASFRQIGQDMGWSPSVIEDEAERIRLAFGASDRHDSIRRARRVGLLPLAFSDFAPVLRSMMERRAA